jgi:hypothetical protein
MAVLIVSDPVDLHASSIAWGLDQYGAEAILWHPAPPWVKPGSVRFDSASVDYRFAGEGGDIAPSAIDAVWMRRWPEPAFPSSLRECDKIASRKELVAYHEGLLELLPRGILWANPLATRRSARFRLKQLAAAISVGLPIPRTIVTDDAAQARKFVASHREGEVVYRPLHTFHGERPDKPIDQSSPVTCADLDDPQGLVWSPGIFQKSVPRACGLRVAMFGRTCVSAKVLDQDILARGARQSVGVAPYELPDAVERKLHALMEKLGLVMAMVDLIITPQGDHVFLEVEEQGQFIWLEEMCPELPLVDTAARFLACGDPYFRIDVVPGMGLKYANYLKIGDKFAEDGDGLASARGVHCSSAPN